MNFRVTLHIALVAFVATACQNVPRLSDDGRVVASVGERVLRLGEITSSLPESASGQDSLDFVSLYIERWVKRQVKIREAERIFSSSVSEIEKMVGEYRQSLLTHKLDQYYITDSEESPYSDDDVQQFYRENMDLLRLNTPIVKGTILKIPKSYDGLRSLRRTMQRGDADSRLNLLSICDRIDSAETFELNRQWMEYDDFISRLPVVRGNSSDIYMKRDGVQSLSDDRYNYLFEIVAYRSKGYVAPLERVRSEIERILTTQYQQELIRQREQRLYNIARRSGDIEIYLDKEELNESEK